MILSSDTKIHRDHRQWSEERALWGEEVRLWQSEIDRALVALRRIEIALARQKLELRSHEAALPRAEACDARGERALIQFELDGNQERKMLLAHAHESEVARQARQRQRHEGLKATQRRLVAYLGALSEIVERLAPVTNS